MLLHSYNVVNGLRLFCRVKSIMAGGAMSCNTHG
jgi:hypothetical protein